MLPRLTRTDVADRRPGYAVPHGEVSHRQHALSDRTHVSCAERRAMVSFARCGESQPRGVGTVIRGRHPFEVRHAVVRLAPVDMIYVLARTRQSDEGARDKAMHKEATLAAGDVDERHAMIAVRTAAGPQDAPWVRPGAILQASYATLAANLVEGFVASHPSPYFSWKIGRRARRIARAIPLPARYAVVGPAARCLSVTLLRAVWPTLRLARLWWAAAQFRRRARYLGPANGAHYLHGRHYSAFILGVP